MPLEVDTLQKLSWVSRSASIKWILENVLGSKGGQYDIDSDKFMKLRLNMLKTMK